jgi:hypothetical protein
LKSCRGSDRKHAPLRDGSYPQQNELSDRGIKLHGIHPPPIPPAVQAMQALLTLERRSQCRYLVATAPSSHSSAPGSLPLLPVTAPSHRLCRRQASSSPDWPRLAGRTPLAKRHFDAVLGVCRNGGCRYRGDLLPVRRSTCRACYLSAQPDPLHPHAHRAERHRHLHRLRGGLSHPDR